MELEDKVEGILQSKKLANDVFDIFEDLEVKFWDCGRAKSWRKPVCNAVQLNSKVYFEHINLSKTEVFLNDRVRNVRNDF